MAPAVASLLLQQLSAWRTTLRALGPLRLHDDYEEDQADGERRAPLVLRVHGGLLTVTMHDGVLRCASEALSALTLLARVDITAWRAEVRALWPDFDLEQVATAQYRRWREIEMAPL